MMLIALGLLVGLVLALTGAGGSIIAVPLLIFGMGWDITQASPVALLAVAGSSAFGTAMGLCAKLVRYRAAGLMAGAGILMTPLGLYVAHRVPLMPLTLAFAALLAWVAWRMFRQARQLLDGAADVVAAGSSLDCAPSAPCLINPDTGRFQWTGRCGRALSVAGLATGFLSGLFGVGGGFLIVPTLRRVTDLPMNAVVATSMMVITLVSSAAVVSAAIAGHLPGPSALPFLVGAITGMMSGRLIASKIAGPRLQQGFSVLTGLVAMALAARIVLA